MGPSALSRLDRDVLSVPGLSDVVLLEGINDIGISGVGPLGTQPVLATTYLVAGYKQIAMRTHARGVKIFIGTLTPFEGAFYFSEDKWKERETVNAWIRTSKDFDGESDFDAVVRDPAYPSRQNAQSIPGTTFTQAPLGTKPWAMQSTCHCSSEKPWTRRRSENEATSKNKRETICSFNSSQPFSA